MKARFLIVWIVVIAMVGLMSHIVRPDTEDWPGGGRGVATVVSTHAATAVPHLASQ